MLSEELTIKNKIIDYIYEVYRWKIQHKIDKSSYLSIMADNITDVSELIQMVLVYRYEADNTIIRILKIFLIERSKIHKVLLIKFYDS